MSEEEKIEINNLKRALEIHHINNEILFKIENLIQKQQIEIEEQDKIINEMALMIDKLLINVDFEKEIITSKGKDIECIKKYFERKVKNGL